MDRTFYTKLTYEHKCQEDFGPRTITTEETAWDLDGPALVEMFHTIMIGAGYSEDGFVGSLRGWLEEHCPEECTESENS